MARKWTVENIPDLQGKTFVVTGGNSGIGWEACLGLAKKGAHVVLACRNQKKGEEARSAILEKAPESSVEVASLDLASLESVRAFAENVGGAHPVLHGLINNAGVMALPYQKTADGFEMQFGTNHLGHFALTGRLLENLLRAPAARVVNVSSQAHRMVPMNFEDLQWEKNYKRWDAYGQSKLSNLLFTFELQRRLEQAGKKMLSVACHPGYSSTNLQGHTRSMVQGLVMKIGNALMAQDADMGALPTLYAATAPDVQGGDYFGPSGIGEMRGYPKKVGTHKRAQDPESARRLWEISEELTQVSYSPLKQ